MPAALGAARAAHGPGNPSRFNPRRSCSTRRGMTRRIPLWLTLVPLAGGVAVYALLWQGWARDFEATLRPWLPGTELGVGGFPYRLEARVEQPRLVGGDVVRLSATAARARINRGPFARDLTVIGTEVPRFAAVVGPVIAATVAGKSALTSINVEGGRLRRLSTVVEAATVRLGLTPVGITAESLELHLRERRGADAPPPATAPTPAPRGQLVIAGTGARFGTGAPLTLTADLTATGPARLTAYDRWATSGTIEVTRLTLADASGEVASLRATLVPRGRAELRFAGTITTVCPLSVAAAFAAAPPVSENRLRAPVVLAFEGTPGTLRLTGIPAELARRAVRAQLPPCPRLRG